MVMGLVERVDRGPLDRDGCIRDEGRRKSEGVHGVFLRATDELGVDARGQTGSGWGTSYHLSISGSRGRTW